MKKKLYIFFSILFCFSTIFWKLGEPTRGWSSQIEDILAYKKVESTHFTAKLDELGWLTCTALLQSQSFFLFEFQKLKRVLFVR
jgi:hypothetical protein